MTTIRDHDLLLLVTCSLYRFRVSISAISAITIRAVNINQIESDLKKPGWEGEGDIMWSLCCHYQPDLFPVFDQVLMFMAPCVQMEGDTVASLRTAADT